MADQQSRGGKKQGGDTDVGRAEQHQGVRGGGQGGDRRPDAGAGQAGKRKDDPSEAPESGDRKATG